MKKVALITGASRGIGREIALRLAKEGYAVAVNFCHHADEAMETACRISNDGGCAFAIRADVSDSREVQQMVESVQEELGPISVLVNNAGVAQQKLFTDITDEDWDTMVGTHLSGTFYCCRAVLPEMIRRHEGSIINVSSMWGQTGGSCEVHYSAVKAGIIGLTKALAKEVGPSGIRVNCVAPGVIKTDMTAGLGKETLDDLAEETPLCRIGMPADVASAVAFLASEQADFITGQVLAPNGGIVI